MEKFIAAVFLCLVAAGCMLILPMLFGICGAIVGVSFGWLFPASMTQLDNLIGLSADYQTGALLGFLSAFFSRSSK